MTRCRLIVGVASFLIAIAVGYAHAASAFGHVDKATADEVAGWACDPDSAQSSVNVRILFVGPQSVFGPHETVELLADESSEQAVSELCGGGSRHRFSYVPGSDVIAAMSVLPAGERMAYVYARDRNNHKLYSLWGSPMELILAPKKCPSLSDFGGNLAVNGFTEYSKRRVGGNTGTNFAQYFWIRDDGAPMNGTPPVDGRASFGLFAAVEQHQVFEFLHLPPPSLVQAVGIMKFEVPVPPCDVRVRWSSRLNVRLGRGFLKSGGSANADIRAVFKNQPQRASFPSGPFIDLKMSMIPFSWSTPPSKGRPTVGHALLEGSYIIPANRASSVLMGVWSLLVASDGKACYGNCSVSPENFASIATSENEDQTLSIDYTFSPL